MINIAARVIQPFTKSSPPPAQADARVTAVATEAATVLDTARGQASISTLAHGNGRLHNALHGLLQQVPAADKGLAQSLRAAQEAIAVLTRSLPDAPHPSRRFETERLRTEIAATQNLVHHVIAKSVRASEPGRDALKAFMKTIYPNPDDLAVHADHALPPERQTDLADHSRRLQRFAGVPRRRDLAGWAGTLRIGRNHGAAAGSAGQVRTLAFIAARSGNEKQRSRAVGKLGQILRSDEKSGARDSMASVLNEATARLTANTSLNAFYRLYDRLVAGEASHAEQDAAADALDQVLRWHDEGRIDLPVPQRFDIARALEPLANGGNARFHTLRESFFDAEVRAFASGAAKGFTPDLIRDMGPSIQFNDAPQGAASTRAAGYVTLDGETYYCKEIGHGPRAALSEYLSMQLIALTGQTAPVTRIGRLGNQFVILSRVMPGYQDLGKLLLDTNRMSRYAEREWGEAGRNKVQALSARAHAANAEIERLGAEGYDRKSAARKRPRKALFEARARLMNMLPADMSRQLHKAQFLSRLVAHNDFLNGEFHNVGFNDRDECVVLDFGNALNQGFGGKQRNEDNRALANRLAYPENDPYPPNFILEGEHVFSGAVGTTRTNVGGIPRSGPTARVVADAIRTETTLAESGGTREQMTAVPAHQINALQGQLEAAYQLSLLPDDAIRAVAVRHWADPDDDSVPYREGDPIRQTGSELADILIERRHALVGLFTPDELSRWAQTYPQRARQCHDDVAKAVGELAGMSIRGFSLLSPADGAGSSQSRPHSV